MKYRIALIAFLLLIVSVIVTLNYYFDRNYQAEMADQINNQQLILAKTLSMSIENTLDHFMEEIMSLARLLSRRGLESEGLDEFVHHAFEELNENIKVDITVVKAGRKVIFTSVKDYSMSEEDLGICDMCRSLDMGSYHIVPSSADRKKIKAITPIISKGVHVGAILLSIDIDDLNRQFIMPVKTGPKGNAWIMDSQGTLLYHPTMPEMVGRNIRNHRGECFECHKSFNAELDILNSSDVGFSSYVAPYGEDKLIAFSRIDSMGWIVCLTIPFSEVTRTIKTSMRMHSMLVLSIMFSTVFVAFFIIAINRARARAEAKAGYADKIREYADELESIVTKRTGELKSEKEKLDVLVASIHAGIGIFDHDFRCIWHNRLLYEWVSPEKGELYLDDICPSMSYGQKVKGAVIDDQSMQEVSYLELGAKKGYFQITLSPCHMPDGSPQILLLLQDITDLKMAEEQMIQSDKLAALSRLSAGVAHEIGNPLTSISSYVQILKGMDLKDEFASTSLETIYRHIGRIDTILKKMSSFSKGRDDEWDRFQLRELVDNTVELVKYDKRARGVDIRVDIPEGLPPVNINGNQMIQVIMNLMLNAADSMAEGGSLHVYAVQGEKWVDLVFQDTGSGISEEDLTKIFDPFFTTKKTGTGLGLAVCHSIIGHFGGDILVESEPGKGSKFTVRLPFEKE